MELFWRNKLVFPKCSVSRTVQLRQGRVASLFSGKFRYQKTRCITTSALRSQQDAHSSLVFRKCATRSAFNGRCLCAIAERRSSDDLKGRLRYESPNMRASYELRGSMDRRAASEDALWYSRARDSSRSEFLPSRRKCSSCSSSCMSSSPSLR